MRPFLNLATIKSPHVQAADCHFRVAPLSEHTYVYKYTQAHMDQLSWLMQQLHVNREKSLQQKRWQLPKLRGREVNYFTNG